MSAYDIETKSLKEKIKNEAKRVYSIKNQFIQKNKSLQKIKEKDRDRINNSTIEIRNKEVGMQNDLSPEALELKREYEVIGKRVQLLKIQKLALTIEDDNHEKRKTLEMLKRKYAEICKL